MLSDFAVTVPELGTITADRAPFVVLTSNATRELSEALKRRCLFLHIDFPSPELERRILLSRVPELPGHIADELVRIIGVLRGMQLKKLPSVAETIDWGRTVLALGMDTSTEDFIREVRDRPSPLNDLIASYVHAFLVLTSLVAACNRLHPIDERLCRWLRMTYNRARRTEFPIRHEFLAQMLGVHRPTVSTAASMLQKAGLIQYHYGKLTILNPDGLSQGACECYGLMEQQFDKMFSHSLAGESLNS